MALRILTLSELAQTMIRHGTLQCITKIQSFMILTMPNAPKQQRRIYLSHLRDDP